MAVSIRKGSEIQAEYESQSMACGQEMPATNCDENRAHGSWALQASQDSIADGAASKWPLLPQASNLPPNVSLANVAMVFAADGLAILRRCWKANT